jgi:hypothetical protein
MTLDDDGFFLQYQDQTSVHSWGTVITQDYLIWLKIKN